MAAEVHGEARLKHIYIYTHMQTVRQTYIYLCAYIQKHLIIIPVFRWARSMGTIDGCVIGSGLVNGQLPRLVQASRFVCANGGARPVREVRSGFCVGFGSVIPKDDVNPPHQGLHLWQRPLYLSVSL